MAKEKAKSTDGAVATVAVGWTITGTQDRVTKNAVRFQEDVAEGVQPDAYVSKIGQIYVQKAALGGAPKRIRVTVEVIEA
jgi:hypothetical protein